MTTSETSIEEINESIEFRKELGENIRCTLVGDLECGKTSVLLSYLLDSCPVQYVPTIFDSYSKRVKFRGRTINLLLNDIGGNKELDHFVTGDVVTGDIGADICTQTQLPQMEIMKLRKMCSVNDIHFFLYIH